MNPTIGDVLDSSDSLAVQSEHVDVGAWPPSEQVGSRDNVMAVKFDTESGADVAVFASRRATQKLLSSERLLLDQVLWGLTSHRKLRRATTLAKTLGPPQTGLA